jgi:hypothetical protein
MRKRKRPDWQVRVYDFWCEPAGPLPQAVWDVAREMQRVWNALAGALEERRQAAEKAQTKIDWKEFRAAAEVLVKASTLNWEQGPDVLDRFLSALKRLKQGGGFPKIHHRLDRWQIPHRYTGGGVPVRALYSPGAARFSLVPVAERAYRQNERASRRERFTRARFGVGEETVGLNVILHRPIPAEALVKKVALGGRETPLGWKFHLAVTCEMAPEERVRQGPEAACGLDLGWRKFDDYVRIGMKYDGQKYEELKLPLDAPTNRSRRSGLPSSWQALEIYDQKRAGLLEACKAAIKPALEGVQDESLKAFHLLGWKGLRRLAERVSAALPDVAARIEASRRDQAQVLRLENRLHSRLIGRRRALYQQMALDLCRKYTEIRWEGDLALKQMAEAEKMTPALRNAMQYRTIASLYEFRHWLKNAADKTGARLMEVKAAGTTRQCSWCGAEVEGGLEKVVVRCANGHEFDQDCNAARNLFSQTGPDLAQKEGLRKIAGGGQTEGPENQGGSAAVAG